MRPSMIKPTDLKLLVSHKTSIDRGATVEQLRELFEEKRVRTIAVTSGSAVIGICRSDHPALALGSADPGGKLRRGLLAMLQDPQAARSRTLVDEVMVPDPVILTYGVETEDAFRAAFKRQTDRYSEDLVLTTKEGRFFGIIRSEAMTNLLYAFVDEHMKELQNQKHALALKHSQVVRMTEDLERTNRKLEAARDEALSGTRMKSQFLANMSHEIRTPMNGVFGMIDLLFDTHLDEEQQQLASTARSSAETLLRLIDDILDLSKIEAGKFDIFEDPFDLEDTVECSVALYTERAKEKDIDLELTFENAPPWVVGDSSRYQQILNNLISNAIKFTSEGRVEVKLTGFTVNGRQGIRTEVIDTGIGLDPDTIGNLFQPFVQADGSTSRKFGGTGLGLSICRRLAELMGGEIDCISTPDVGSNFYFDLPFQHYNPDAAGTEVRPVDSRVVCNQGGTRTAPDFTGMEVVVVEDNTVNQEVARRILNKLGCKVSVAENGKAALTLIANQHVDCVFMDCQMPVMDGYQATRQIRAGECGDHKRETFVCAMTAHAMVGDKEKCLRAGMDSYLTKPVNPDGFRSALSLARRRTPGNVVATRSEDFTTPPTYGAGSAG